jgi:hypothetical protein
MTTAGERIEPHIPEHIRETATGMIANQQYRYLGKRVDYIEWRRLAGGQQMCIGIWFEAV